MFNNSKLRGIYDHWFSPSLSQPGDIPANIRLHTHWIARAAAQGADWVLFPELSLTGYEPALADALALFPDDDRLNIFQEMADRHRLTIGLGIPLRQKAGVCIATVLCGPHQPRHFYTKQDLHPDEEPFFVPGHNASPLVGPGLALAICYELSIPGHARRAAASGADSYLASVAKSAAGIQKSRERLAEIAHTYALRTALVNCVGPADDFVGAGQSFVLGQKGELLGQLNETEEALLLVNTDTEEVVKSG